MTLNRMTLDDKIGQLLHPAVPPSISEADYDELMGPVQPGGMFFFPGTRDEFCSCARMVQQKATVPVLISSDLENGAGRMVKDAVQFPDLMGLAATDSVDLAHAMGKAAAREGRELGVHWTFGPVMDINANPFNPITNTRGLGDDPERISRLGCALIRSMQKHGLCATAKHFPGDGFDIRDQHVCTTINPLSLDDWQATSGRMFASAIAAGAWSIMVGHIALPAVDPGDGGLPRPATLSPVLLNDLLRTQLGFDGVIITDAMGMGGVTSQGPRETILPGAINAGCDMILFSQPQRDFTILRDAVKQGILSEERLDQSVRRLLELRVKVGLHESTAPVPLETGDRERFKRASITMAERAMTIAKGDRSLLPLALEPGKRVLCYHYRGDPAYQVDAFDDMLRSRGCEVVRFSEDQTDGLPGEPELAEFEAILMPFVFGPSWGTGRIRPCGNGMRTVTTLMNARHPKTILISFGTPYLEYEVPHIPLLVNAYSIDPHTQNAVVRLLAGEIDAAGISPVDLHHPWLANTAFESVSPSSRK